MYKKLILTFTLAAGLSVLPNAFAAPSTKPGPAPKPKSTTNTQFKDSIDVLAWKIVPPKGRHGEDSIDVFAVDMTTAPEPKYKRPGRPPPKGKYGEDRIDVLAFKARPQPAPPSKPNTTKTPVHSEDSIDVLADFRHPPPKRPPPKVRHGEDSATVLARKIPPPLRPIKHGLDSTIV